MWVKKKKKKSQLLYSEINSIDLYNRITWKMIQHFPLLGKWLSPKVTYQILKLFKWLKDSLVSFVLLVLFLLFLSSFYSLESPCWLESLFKVKCEIFYTMMSKVSMNDPTRNPFVGKFQPRLRWWTRPGHAGDRKVPDDFRRARSPCLKRGALRHQDREGTLSHPLAPHWWGCSLGRRRITKKWWFDLWRKRFEII